MTTTDVSSVPGRCGRKRVGSEKIKKGLIARHTGQWADLQSLSANGLIAKFLDQLADSEAYWPMA